MTKEERKRTNKLVMDELWNGHTVSFIQGECLALVDENMVFTDEWKRNLKDWTENVGELMSGYAYRLSIIREARRMLENGEINNITRKGAGE